MGTTSEPTPAAGGFHRVLGRKEVLAIAFGAMVGWGWVVLAGGWIGRAGPVGAVAAFVLGGIAVALIGLTYAELAAAMPLAGGEHVYSYRAFGATASFACTWAIVLGYASVVAFEAVALPTVVDFVVPGYAAGHLWSVAGWDVKLSWVLVGVLGAVAMTAVNVVGIRTSGRLQTAVTLALLVAGSVFVVAALAGGSRARLEPGFVGGLDGVLGVLVMVPFMFVGFDVIPQAAEEVDLPARDIGRLLIVSVGMAVAWYVLIVLGVGLSLGGAAAESTIATADAARVVLGPWGSSLIVVAGLGGIVTSWNAFLVGGSRAVWALAHARMLPHGLARLHPRFGTPYRAVILIGALSAVAPLFGRAVLVWLVDAGGLGIVVAYAFVAASFVALRVREPDMPRPYRVGRWRVVGGTAVVLSVAMAALYLPGSPAALAWPEEWAIVFVWSVLGAGLYAWSRARYGAPDPVRVMSAAEPAGAE